MVVQGFGGSEYWERVPTPEEVRAMVYAGVVRGASGILYWLRIVYELVDVIAEVGREVKVLSPVLTGYVWYGDAILEGDGWVVGSVWADVKLGVSGNIEVKDSNQNHFNNNNNDYNNNNNSLAQKEMTKTEGLGRRGRSARDKEEEDDEEERRKNAASAADLILVASAGGILFACIYPEYASNILENYKAKITERRHQSMLEFMSTEREYILGDMKSFFSKSKKKGKGATQSLMFADQIYHQEIAEDARKMLFQPPILRFGILTGPSGSGKTRLIRTLAHEQPYYAFLSFGLTSSAKSIVDELGEEIGYDFDDWTERMLQ
ncbi:hypothetical protein HDU99_007505, partial [Rhizoclosmatium hyalinum]